MATHYTPAVHYEGEESFRKNIFAIQKYLESRYNVAVYDHTFFESYLRKCDNNLFECLKKIDDFFAFKKTFPEYLLSANVEDSSFGDFCKSTYSFYLPELTENGYRVFIDRVTNDERLFDVFKIMKYYCMQTEMRFLENYMENGDVILFDCNNINLFHFAAFVPYFMKTLFLITAIYPLRIKLLILINTGRLVETLINWLKILLPKENREMLFVYATGEEYFSKHISADILPKEYGGTSFSLNELREKCYNNLLLHSDWFVKANAEIENLKCDGVADFHISFGRNETFKSLHFD